MSKKEKVSLGSLIRKIFEIPPQSSHIDQYKNCNCTACIGKRHVLNEEITPTKPTRGKRS